LIVLAEDSSSVHRLTFDSVSEWAADRYGIGIARVTQNPNDHSKVTQYFNDVSGNTQDANKVEENSKNEAETPRVADNVPSPRRESVGTSLEKLEAVLNCIDPDCGYLDWTRVSMGIYHETNGSDEGLALFDRFSFKGKKYPGSKIIETKWRSFRNVPSPVTMGTLIKMAKDVGADVAAIMGDKFEPLEDEDSEIREEVPQSVTVPDQIINPLDKYSLLGMSDEIEKQVMEEVYVLDDIVLIGQSTAIYAAPNTGKTLLALVGITESIKHGRINPAHVYYINVDDTASHRITEWNQKYYQIHETRSAVNPR